MKVSIMKSNHSHCLKVTLIIHICMYSMGIHHYMMLLRKELCESLIRSGLDPNATNEVSV